MTARKEQEQEKLKEIKLPPFIWYIVIFFAGAFAGAFLTYEVSKNRFKEQECFLVHEAEGENVLGETGEAGGAGEVKESSPAPSLTSPNPLTTPKVFPKSSLVNLNTASLSELDTLPGIGPAYAQKIIDGRPYANIEGVMAVKGIGPKTFEKIRALVTVE